MKKLVFLFSVVVLFIACTNTVKKHVTEVHDNGAPKLISYYHYADNDSILVRDEWYYEDSTLRMEGNYLDGQKNGTWVAYYPDGTPWSIGDFKDGLSHGSRTVYHENGEIYYTGQYTNDKRSGHWEFFNNKGEKVKEIDY
jgi:antitoxin component YwqK of YwqJK toxin-antitoxin module